MKYKLLLPLSLAATGAACSQAAPEAVDMQGLWKWSNVDTGAAVPVLKTHTLVLKNNSFEESLEEGHEMKLADQGTYTVNQNGVDISLHLSGSTPKVYHGKWAVDQLMIEQTNNIKLDVPALFKRQ